MAPGAAVQRSLVGPVIVYAFVLLIAIGTSMPRRTGDGQEYMAMAVNIAHGHAPSLSAGDRQAFDVWADRVGANYPGSLEHRPELVRNGREEFSHFWLYSLMAAPLVAIADVTGSDRGWAFTVVNALLLVAAFAVVIRRIPMSMALILFISPVFWWVDKPAVEPFMFSLIALAIALLDRAPWWSLVALGLASTQNPAVVLVLPIAWLAALGIDRRWLRDRRFWAGSAVATGLSVLHPLYYLATLGVYTPQALVGSTRLRIPTPVEYLAPVIDLNIGLIPHVPLLAAAVIVLGVIPLARQRHVSVPVVAAAAMAAVFLFGFSQTTHFNHGTQGSSRYALWLVPLAIPLFAAAASMWGRRATNAAIALAAASYVVAWASYPPRVEGNDYLFPTPIASLVWALAPALDNPLPAIFFSRTAHREGLPESIGNPSCSKVLIVDGVQAPDCPVPGPLPINCFEPTGMCYANRDGDQYAFVATERDIRR